MQRCLSTKSELYSGCLIAAITARTVAMVKADMIHFAIPSIVVATKNSMAQMTATRIGTIKRDAKIIGKALAMIAKQRIATPAVLTMAEDVEDERIQR